MQHSRNPERALVHPAWWLSLALLAFNDHVLKGAGLLPGAITGKLSDLAGMMVAPVLFAALVRARSRAALLACHAAVGLVFAAIKLSEPAATAWSGLMGLFGAPWTIISDPTDLLALPVLYLSWRVLVPAMAADASWARRGAETLLAAVGLLFSIATSEVDCEDDGSCGCIDNDGDGSCAVDDCDDNDAALSYICCIDADADGVCSDEDCDDADATRSNSCCVDMDADGVCATFDCDEADPEVWACCVDGDGDGVCSDEDCNDANPNLFDCSCSQATQLALGPQTGDSSFPSHTRAVSCAIGGWGVLGQYQVTSEGLRWITLSVASETPHVLAASDSCDLAATLICEPAALSHDKGLLAVSGASVFTYVQPAAPADAGPFTLTVTDEPLECGDGLPVGPEGCDDGNLMDGDGCDANCQVE